MDVDEEDFVFYGTPIEREEDVASRKKKSVAEASGQLRTLPSWKQEVKISNQNGFFSAKKLRQSETGVPNLVSLVRNLVCGQQFGSV